MRKEGVPDGQLMKDGRVIFKTDQRVKPGKTFMMFNKALNLSAGQTVESGCTSGSTSSRRGSNKSDIMDPVKGAPDHPN